MSQLTSADQLRGEGARMRHCVATSLRQVEAGGLVICSAMVHGHRLTISVVRAARGWRLSECAGFGNREPSPAELRPWLDASRIEARSGRIG